VIRAKTQTEATLAHPAGQEMEPSPNTSHCAHRGPGVPLQQGAQFGSVYSILWSPFAWRPAPRLHLAMTQETLGKQGLAGDLPQQGQGQ
jgi:hypothetical protein